MGSFSFPSTEFNLLTYNLPRIVAVFLALRS
jgi:hypothetical protein